MRQPVVKFICLFLFSFFCFFRANAQQENLEIYWIDVEGGAATLIVTPGRQVVLMDAGFQRDDGRDSGRIMEAMEDAGVTEIDYFLASHFHGDHVGGLSSLSANVPIKEFIDHGGFDLRILLIGDRAFSMRRSNDRDWRTNVSRGARTEPVELSAELLELARQAANVIQAPLAGVDLLLAPSGQPYVLEVNAVPGWKALAKTLEVDISRHVWDYLATQLSPG